MTYFCSWLELALLKIQAELLWYPVTIF